MKKLMIVGLAAPKATGDAAALQKVGEKFVIAEGDWSFNEFKKFAKRETVRNNFNYEDSCSMEAVALGKLLNATNRFDASKGHTFAEYFGKSIMNAMHKAAAVFENTLRLDVALVIDSLEPRDREWCRKVLEGYSPSEAVKAVKFSSSNYYAYVLPRLQEAFKHLRYAVGK